MDSLMLVYGIWFVFSLGSAATFPSICQFLFDKFQDTLTYKLSNGNSEIKAGYMTTSFILEASFIVMTITSFILFVNKISG